MFQELFEITKPLKLLLFNILQPELWKMNMDFYSKSTELFE